MTFAEVQTANEAAMAAFLARPQADVDAENEARLAAYFTATATFLRFPLRTISRAAQHAYVTHDATCTNTCVECNAPTGTWDADLCLRCVKAGVEA